VLVDVSTEILICRPRSEVAEFAADPSRWQRWYANLASVQCVAPLPLPRGARIAFVLHFLGQDVASTYEVVEHVPGSRLAMRASDGTMPMETTMTWDGASAGMTRMILSNRCEPGAAFAPFSPIVASALREANRTDLGRLRTLLRG
jgi:hypothetical protein